MKKLGAALFINMLLIGCGGEAVDPYDPLDAGEVAIGGKADGYAINIELDKELAGTAAGGAFSLYKIELMKGATIAVDIAQTEGDVQPQGFLFKNLDWLTEDQPPVEPAPGYVYGNGQLQIEWTAPATAEYFLIVRAAKETAGSYRLLVSCKSGACALPDPDQVQQNEDALKKLLGALQYTTPNGGHGIGRFDIGDFDLEREVKAIDDTGYVPSEIMECLFPALVGATQPSCGTTREFKTDTADVLNAFVGVVSTWHQAVDGKPSFYCEYNDWDSFKDHHGLPESLNLENINNLPQQVKDIVVSDYQKVYDLIADPTNLGVISSIPTDWYCCNSYWTFYVFRADGIYLRLNFDHSD